MNNETFVVVLQNMYLYYISYIIPYKIYELVCKGETD